MMTGPQFTIDTMPLPYGYYGKAIWGRRRYQEGQPIPQTRVDWSSFVFDKKLVESYAKLTSWDFDGTSVPLLFPHSFFGPLHLQMLTEDSFPLRVLGGVHLRNHVWQQRSLQVGENYRASLYFTGDRRRPQGLEIDFRTEIWQGQSLVWESLTTFLFRRKLKGEDPESDLSSVLSNSSDLLEKAEFPVPLLTGKMFGWLTKDINPIHMSRLCAKLFGFERDLCHGMWALSRSLPLVGGVDWQLPVRNDVWFKGPLYMERKVTIKTSQSQPQNFELYSEGNERPCVLARLINVSDKRLR